MSCPVCFERFSNTAEEPTAPWTLAPCGHTVCLGCLHQLGANGSALCPMCRKLPVSQAPDRGLMEQLELEGEAQRALADEIQKIDKELEAVGEPANVARAQLARVQGAVWPAAVDRQVEHLTEGEARGDTAKRRRRGRGKRRRGQLLQALLKIARNKDDVARAFAANSQVTTLSFDIMHVDDDEAEEWVEARLEGERALVGLLARTPALTSLRLKGLQSARWARPLADVLKRNQTWTSLDLDFCEVGDDGERALADALRQNPSLTRLSLMYCRVGDDGARALADALKRNETLTSLNLKYSRVGDDGARALADALTYNQTLTSLDFGHFKGGDDGARALAEALKRNQTLTSLDLSVCKVGNDGVRALADALKRNETLTSLDLCECEVGVDGARALADALTYNQTLTSLDLDFLEVRGQARTIIADALERNQSLGLE